MLGDWVNYSVFASRQDHFEMWPAESDLSGISG